MSIMAKQFKNFIMRKKLQTSKKSLDSLKGKKFGNLKMINAGNEAEMAYCITLIYNGGTADDSSWDRK